MPFSIRPHRRFPVQVLRDVQRGSIPGARYDLESMNGWRLSGDLPMRPGEILSLWSRSPMSNVSRSFKRLSDDHAVSSFL